MTTQRAKRYPLKNILSLSRAYLWIIRDIIRTQKALFFGNIAIESLSRLVQLSSLVIGVKFITTLYGNRPTFVYKGITIHVHSYKTLVIVAALTLTLLSISALLTHLSRFISVRAMVNYEKTCSKNFIFELLSPETPHLLLKDFSSSFILKLLNRGGRLAGRFLGEIFNLIVPILTIVGALGYLLYNHPIFTLALMLLIPPFFIIYMKIGSHGSKVSHSLEKYSRLDSREKALFIRKTLESKDFSTTPKKKHIDKILFTDFHAELMDAYAKRLIIGQMSLTTGGIQFAFAICFILLFLGHNKLSGTASAASPLYFLMAGNYLFLSLKVVGKSLTNMHLFYYHFKEYVSLRSKSFENFSKKRVISEKVGIAALEKQSWTLVHSFLRRVNIDYPSQSFDQIKVIQSPEDIEKVISHLNNSKSISFSLIILDTFSFIGSDIDLKEACATLSKFAKVICYYNSRRAVSLYNDESLIYYYNNGEWASGRTDVNETFDKIKKITPATQISQEHNDNLLELDMF